MIGKNPQVSLDFSFENIIKDEEEFKNLLQYYNKEIDKKVMLLFNKEYSTELKEIYNKIFNKFMQVKGKKYLHMLLLLEKEQIEK